MNPCLWYGPMMPLARIATRRSGSGPDDDREKGIPMGDPLMQFFDYVHLPPFLQGISQRFNQLAQEMVDELPVNAERSAGLRKLLEAKDCMVRARLFIDPRAADRQ